MEHESDSDTNSNWYTWNNPQKLGEGVVGIGNWRTSRDYSKYIIVKICQNTEKSPGDLKRLAVTQTPVKNHQLMLM